MSVARRCLMIPHYKSEEYSIMQTFMECTYAFHHLDESELDDVAQGWVREIKELMDVSNQCDTGDGLGLAKARTLTYDQRLTLSNAVDELAHWFARNC